VFNIEQIPFPPHGMVVNGAKCVQRGRIPVPEEGILDREQRRLKKMSAGLGCIGGCVTQR
jgi:hypothetical protein